MSVAQVSLEAWFGGVNRLYPNGKLAHGVSDLSVRRIKDRNAQQDQQAILDLIDEEVDAERASRA